MRYQETMTAGKAVVECLKIEGVKHVFNVPGESFLAVLDELESQSEIELLSARHEGGAGFMAEGYAKVSGKVGVAMATRGVGGANISIAIHTAFQDSTPMVVFLGQVKREFREREGFQEVDFGRNFKEIAKWTVEISDAKRVPELVQRAFRVAQTGRPGPVVVSLPEDMLLDEALMTFGPPTQKSKPVPSPEELKKFEELLSKAERPIVIAGGGIRRSGAEDALVEFLDKYKLPVAAGYRRHDLINNEHEAYIGQFILSAPPSLIQHVKESDLVIALGTRLSEATSQDYSILPWGQSLVHVDIEASTIGKVYAPDLGIVSDLNSALKAFTKLDLDKNWSEWQAVCRRSFEKLVENPGDGSIYSEIARVIHDQLPEEAMLTMDAGNFASWFNTGFPLRRSNSLIAPTNGAMGYGLPAAVGAKHAVPDRPVIALCGDGGVMMTVQEIETSVRSKRPIVCIVFNNGKYGTIRMHQELHYPGKVIGTDIGNVDFAKMAEGMGAVGVKVENKEGFEGAFKEALSRNVTTLIDVRCHDVEHIVNGKTIRDLRSISVR
ncbi:thiamine pyrophosphate-dependent enzyme [Cytobacillus depressus]|nr:thiamine pyrophosphate-dependent enzyme [Cytobacillus depressus]